MNEDQEQEQQEEQQEQEQPVAPVVNTDEPPVWAKALYQEMQELKASNVRPQRDDSDPDAWKFDNERMYEKFKADLSASEKRVFEETVEKPRLIESAISEFAGDNAKAASVIRKQLSGLSRANLEAALKDNDTREALELLAAGAKSKTPQGANAPRSEGINNPANTSGLSAEENREVDKMHRAMSETFGADYTREMAVAAMKRTKEQMV